MQADYLDRYSRLDSPVHRLWAGGKVLVAVGLIVAMVLWPVGRAIYLCVPAIFLAGVAVVSRIPLRFVLRRLILLEPLVLGVAGLAIFQPGGWRLAGVLVARCTLCLLTMILLANTTPFAQMLGILRKLRVPGMLITTLALMYRYLFVLVDEAQRMRRARMSRTFVHDRVWQWRTLSTVLGELFIRASERAERIYSAMCARGWQ